jgi:hypothetical protein
MNRRLEAEREALQSANEDLTGLYEIVWRLNTTMPEVGAAERRQLAEDAVRSLLVRGLIDAYRRANRNDAQGVPIDPQQALALLGSAEAWREPSPGNDEFLILSTSEGLRVSRRPESRPS